MAGKCNKKKPTGKDKLTKRAGGRVTETNTELWNRRKKVLMLRSTAMSTHEIADQLGVSHVTIINDLRAFNDIQDPINAINDIELGYRRVIQQLWITLQKNTEDAYAVARLTTVIAQTWEKIARLHGIERMEANIYNVTQINNQPNDYDKLPEEVLGDEWERRQDVLDVKPEQ